MKGRKFNDFEKDIQKGILIHREIDRYTDTHKVVHRSKSVLTEKYRHYSGVIVDIFYDHILAKNWNDYSKKPLLDYTLDVYGILEANHEILPYRVQQMLKYMIPGNWLYNYRSIEGIGQVLSGMSRRTKFESGMENAVNELEEFFDEFENDFRIFFPDLINFVDSFDPTVE